VIAYFAPGMRFFHQGQLEGCQLRLPVQLCRMPQEPEDLTLQAFYHRLLAALLVTSPLPDTWQLLTPAPAWDGNWTWEGFIGYTWQSTAGKYYLMVVNYSPHQSQCYFSLPIPELRQRFCQLRDWFSPTSYDRLGDDLLNRGLYLDLPEWGYQLFEITISP
jgi:hypothetical protein